MKKKYVAGLSLIISATGMIATLPFAQEGLLGLAHGGFVAATVGGLADWFAVTALFRKPLGISYRTEILRRNRQRLMDSLVDFAANDLLSRQNINRLVERQPVGLMLAEYIDNRGGRTRLKAAIRETAAEAIAGFDTGNLAHKLAPVIAANLRSCPLDGLAADAVSRLGRQLGSEPGEKLLSTGLGVIKEVLLSPQIKNILAANIKLMREAYQEGSAGRAFVLEAAGLTDEKILNMATEEMAKRADEMIAGQGEWYGKLKGAVMSGLEELAKSQMLLDTLHNWQQKYMTDDNLEKIIASWLKENFVKNAMEWLPHLDKYLDELLDNYRCNTHWQEQVDEVVKSIIANGIAKHHSVVPQLIHSRLAEFSDDELTEFVETRVADDLQMIRVNGAVVGGLAGMALYIIKQVGAAL